MIRKLLKSVRNNKKASLLSPLFVTLEVVIEVLIPYFMADMIDIGIANGDMPFVYKVGIFLSIAAIFSLVFGCLSGKYAAIASAGFASNLRLDMFKNIQKFSFSNIDKFSTASLVTRLTTDVSNVQNAYQMIVRVAIRGPIMLIFAVVMSLMVNWNIALIFLVAIPLLGFGLCFIALKAHPYFEKVFSRYDRLNTVVQENVLAVRVVKSYAKEDKEIEKFHEISSDVYQQFKQAEKVIAWNSPLMQFVVYACILLVLAVGSQFIVGNTMQTGQLMSMVVYATQILSSLMMLSMVFVMVIMAQASAKRIVEILDEESNLSNSLDPIYSITDGSVEFENVSTSYTNDNNKNVLSGINFKINEGETVGIIGGTGSSKSTLVSLISRLYDTTAGTVKVGGINVKDYDLVTLRDKVAVVLQKNVLFSGTIKENLLWGDKFATDDKLMYACKLAQADEFIQALTNKYDTFIEQGGTNVSGGQKQRLCIARALLKNPKILIMDDSTSAVDTKTDILIRNALKEKLPVMTKFIIAQRISSVEDADKIIVLDGGSLVGFGTPAQMLCSNKIYQEVYAMQKKGADSYEV